MRNAPSGLSRWGLFWHRLHTRKALLRLTPEQLKDIGLTREQAQRGVQAVLADLKVAGQSLASQLLQGRLDLWELSLLAMAASRTKQNIRPTL
jgi:hypothetical protein